MKLILQILLLLAIAALTVLSMTVPGAANFPNHALARMIFWHLPCALTSTLFICAAPYFALRYLRSNDRIWDLRASSAMEIAMLTGLLTLATGIIFSRVQWGELWSWDPRQTSFLLVVLIMGAYFALRAGMNDAEKRASYSAAYSVASVLPILFLIFVFPRVLISLHPSNTLVQSNGLDPTYRSVFLSLFALVLVLCVWMYRLRVRVGLLEEFLDHARLDVRDDSAPTGVVRPVSLPHDGG